MASTSKLFTAKIILSVVAVFTIVAPVLADWNASHIYNPLWPPHAKFHNAQTMVLGVLLGLATLYFTWQRDASDRSALLTALLFAALYWISQTLAFLFPGVAWTDPNLLGPGQSLEDFPGQIKIDLVVFAILIVTAWLIAGATPKRMQR